MLDFDARRWPWCAQPRRPHRHFWAEPTLHLEWVDHLALVLWGQQLLALAQLLLLLLLRRRRLQQQHRTLVPLSPRHCRRLLSLAIVEHCLQRCVRMRFLPPLLSLNGSCARRRLWRPPSCASTPGLQQQQRQQQQPPQALQPPP